MKKLTKRANDASQSPCSERSEQSIQTGRRNRESESQRFRSNRDSDETDVTDDSALAASVGTLQEAAQISLKDGMSDNCLFIYARALKALEITAGTKLSNYELGSVFAEWWRMAKSQLPADADFDEWRFAFLAAFAQAKTPLGANPLQEASRRADERPAPPQADRYSSARIKRLVAVCFHLQLLAGNAPFFLAVRDANRILGGVGLAKANAVLTGLVRDGVLTVATKAVPGGRRATRYWLAAATCRGTGT